ncbi:MAG: hypothetical protein B7Z54_08580 [Sphingobacteriales bacterium 12-47-4]|nr:MAG: hypothetical protein B7Z54_08580 [Sphingobacteriales bacterium 12-47-4]
MIIYNITIKPDPEISESYLHWLKETHIPAIMATGCFLEFRICRMLDVEEGDGTTLVVQYHAASRTDYETYIREYAPKLREDAFRTWGDRFLAFRSIMEVL